MSQTPEVSAVVAALSEVSDPCSTAMSRPVSIVELGLVDEVVVHDSSRVTVKLVLTDPACPFRQRLSDYITDVLRERLEIGQVGVEMRADKIWIPDVSRVRALRDPATRSAQPRSNLPRPGHRLVADAP